MEDNKTLYLLTSIFNPSNYQSRPKLYNEFAKRMDRTDGVELYTAEVAIGNQPFQVTERHNRRHCQFRSNDVLWFKENLLNLAVKKLPSDWKYCAWIDSDLTFARPDWPEATVEMLDKHKIGQSFSHCSTLDRDHVSFATHKGFCFQRYKHKNDPSLVPEKNYNSWHCGYTFAFTREAYEYIGGFLDFAILGSADFHMSRCFFGKSREALRSPITEDYEQKIIEWGKNAEEVGKDVGYVSGTCLHAHHGSVSNRNYQNRVNILIRNNYCPSKDISYDECGLIKLNRDLDDPIRKDIMEYFNSRNEDGVER